MSWTSKQIIHLIEEYQKYPCLYVSQDKEFHNKRKRMACLSEIAQELSNITRPFTSEVEVERKFNGLQNTYITERGKVLASMSNGQGFEEVYIPPLWYYEHLSFLEDQIPVRNLVDPEVASVTEDFIKVKYEEIEPCTNSRETSPEPFLTRTSSPECSDRRIPQRRNKRKLPEGITDAVNAEGLECLQPISNVFRKARTADDLYGDYVAIRLKALISSRKKLQVRYEIDNLLYEAAINDG